MRIPGGYKEESQAILYAGFLAGKYESRDGEFHGIIVDSYDVGAATFLMDKK